MSDLADYETLTPEFIARSRIDFAQRAFTNAQDLSRMMDQKASSLLYAVGLLTAALGIVGGRALAAPSEGGVQGYLQVIGVLFFAAYFLLAAPVVLFAAQAFRAARHTSRSTTAAPGLLFPLLVLSHISEGDIQNESRYFESLTRLSVPEMLRDYANQVVEISAIYDSKQRAVNRGVAVFRWLTVCWVVTIVLFVVGLVLGGA